MKKVLCAVVAACCFLMMAGCAQNEPVEKWDRRPMLMVEGEIYLDTGKQMPVEIAKEAIIGTITSSVEGSEKPAKNGESNFGCEGAPYAYLDDGVAVLLDNEWTFFEKDEG